MLNALTMLYFAGFVSYGAFLESKTLHPDYLMGVASGVGLGIMAPGIAFDYLFMGSRLAPLVDFIIGLLFWFVAGAFLKAMHGRRRALTHSGPSAPGVVSWVFTRIIRVVEED